MAELDNLIVYAAGPVDDWSDWSDLRRYAPEDLAWDGMDREAFANEVVQRIIKGH